MNYRHVYMLIIEHAKSEMKNGLRPTTKYYRKNFQNQYFEFHHILPKSLFPNWSKKTENLVCLTAREHFFCHQLLTKIYPCYQMYFALSKFMGDFCQNRKLSSKEYECCRKAVSQGNRDFAQKNKDVISEKISKANAARLEKIQNLKDNGLYEQYKKEITEKQLATRAQTISVMSEEEKQKLHEQRSKMCSENAKKSNSKRLKSLEGRWDEINDKIKKTKNQWTEEQRLQYHKNQSDASKKVFQEMTEEDYNNFCKKQSDNAKKRNSGRFWWTDGKVNKFCKDCPGENFYKGLTKHKN